MAPPDVRRRFFRPEPLVDPKPHMVVTRVSINDYQSKEGRGGKIQSNVEYVVSEALKLLVSQQVHGKNN